MEQDEKEEAGPQQRHSPSLLYLTTHLQEAQAQSCTVPSASWIHQGVKVKCILCHITAMERAPNFPGRWMMVFISKYLQATSFLLWLATR